MANLTIRIHSRDAWRGIAAITWALAVVVVRVATITTVLAVLLARSHPMMSTRPETPLRHHAAAPLVVETDPTHELRGHKSLFFDPGTGLPLFASTVGRMNLFHACASPWRDELGRLQVVGVSNGLAPGAPGEPELIRISLPDGAVLDRFPIANPPLARPCWFPDLSARILYIDSRGRLTRLDFDNAAEGQEAPSPVTLSWREGIPGSDGMLMGDLAWPSDPRLGGRVLAVLRNRLGITSRVCFRVAGVERSEPPGSRPRSGGSLRSTPATQDGL
jgi:hypothetical protein